MANFDFMFQEGRSLFEPPLLDLIDFKNWSFMFETFLMSINFDLWDLVVNGSKDSRVCEDEQSSLLNFQACNYLSKSLNGMSLFDSCICANSMWMRLRELYGEKEEASSIRVEQEVQECLMGFNDANSSCQEEFEDFGCFMGFGPSEVKYSSPLHLNSCDDNVCNDSDVDSCDDECASTSSSINLDDDFAMLQGEMKNKKIRKGFIFFMKSLEDAMVENDRKDMEIGRLNALHENCLLEKDMLVENLKCEILKLRNENKKLEHDNIGLIDRTHVYEKLQVDFDELKVKLNDLNACLDELTLEKVRLETQLGKQKVEIE